MRAVVLKNQIRPLSSWAAAAAARRLLSTAPMRAKSRPPPPSEAAAVRAKSRPPPPSDAAAEARPKWRPPPRSDAAAEVRANSRPPSPSEAAEDAEAAREWTPLYRRLSAVGRAPEGTVTTTLNTWVREGRSAREVDLMKYVKELRKYRRYMHALEVMDWLIEVKGMNMTYTNHAIRLDLVAKVKGIEAAEEYLSNLPEPAQNERTYGALLNCYCVKKMEDKALTLYKKMKALKVASSTLVHNNLMSLHMKLGHPEKVPVQFEEMKADNISPDNFTYCILMNSYASVNDIESVDLLIQELEEGGEVTLQWSAYSTLATIYTSASQFGKAESALKKLEGLIDSHDRQVFHFLISLYAGIGNLREVKRVWKSLETTFPKLTNMSYLVMLQALNKLGDIDGMKQYFGEWDSIYRTYDLKLTNVLLGAYLTNGRVEEAESLRERAFEKAGRFDSRICELFLDHYLKSDEIDLALKLVVTATSMVKQGEWKLNKEAIKAFFIYFEKSKDVEGAEQFCKTLEVLDSLDAVVYKLLLRTYLAAGRTEPELRGRIKEANIKIGSETKRLLERVCKGKQSLHLATESKL